MPIQILPIDDVKLVTKPWGYERWIADADGDKSFRYALKEIFIRAPHRSSLQFHKDKQESNYILSGKGILHYGEDPIDIQKFIDGGYTQDEIDAFVQSLKQHELVPGTVFHIRPGFLHRVEAVEDLLMVESSTTELDDVYRISDDSQRGHGRIDSEHTR